jgi:hypothetical protein
MVQLDLLWWRVSSTYPAMHIRREPRMIREEARNTPHLTLLHRNLYLKIVRTSFLSFFKFFILWVELRCKHNMEQFSS